MKILDKLLSVIDRDKVVERKIVENESIEPIRQEVVYIACDRCKAPKLYRLGTDTSYLLHCFACDKMDRVVSL
jgi:hypothetical protein